MAKPKRVKFDELPKEVQEFSERFKDFFWNEFKERPIDEIAIGKASMAVYLAVEALYNFYSDNPIEERIEIEEDIQRIVDISRELARESQWKEVLI